MATRKYAQQNGPVRALFPIWVEASHVIDLRDPAICAELKIDIADREVDWQTYRNRGAAPPSWQISDMLRSLEADGLLYTSRSDPCLYHLTLFRWGQKGAPLVADGPAIPAE